MSQLPMGSVPIGTIVAYFLTTRPSGWLFCDGSAIPPKYQNLIQALGSKKTPNLSGRTLIGTGKPNNIPQTDGRTPNFDPANNWSLNDTGGEYLHILTDQELPPHQHNFTGYNTNFRPAGDNNADSGGDISAADCSSWSTELTDEGVNCNGNGHYNMQPYCAVNYIIFTGQTD